MKRAGWVITVVVAMSCVVFGQTRTFRGTVVRMKMSECTRQHGLVSAMSGVQVVTTEACPEYTVMTEKIVYVLVGRKAEMFMPLAEDIIFHIHKSDVIVISEDEKAKSHFAIRQMTLREDWERDEQHRDVITRTDERNVTYDRSEPRIALRQASSH